MTDLSRHRECSTPTKVNGSPGIDHDHRDAVAGLFGRLATFLGSPWRQVPGRGPKLGNGGLRRMRTMRSHHLRLGTSHAGSCSVLTWSVRVRVRRSIQPLGVVDSAPALRGVINDRWCDQGAPTPSARSGPSTGSGSGSGGRTGTGTRATTTSGRLCSADESATSIWLCSSR